jgi:hypothetical protein
MTSVMQKPLRELIENISCLDMMSLIALEAMSLGDAFYFTSRGRWDEPLSAIQ